jgi:hypothetical protein
MNGNSDTGSTQDTTNGCTHTAINLQRNKRQTSSAFEYHRLTSLFFGTGLRRANVLYGYSVISVMTQDVIVQIVYGQECLWWLYYVTPVFLNYMICSKYSGNASWQ